MGFFQGRGTASLMMVMMMIVSLCVSKGVFATNYKVGDGRWTITSYDSWLSGKTFKVGDTLEFVYSSSAHNVVEVNEADYASCSQGSNTVNTDGDTTYTLSAAGTYYYICSVPTHCEDGMKIAVSVVEAATTTPTTPSTPTPSTSTPTTPSSTTPSTSTPTTTTPSPSNNSSPLSLSPPAFFTSLLTLAGLSILFFKS